MRFGAVSKTYSSFLEKEVGDDKKSFGPKLQAFSKEISSKFERYLYVRIGKQFNERQQVLLAVYSAVIFAKYTKALNNRNDNFFSTIKEKQEFKDISKKNPGYNIEGLLTAIETKIISASQMKDLSTTEERSASKVLPFLNDIVETNAKNASQMISQEQIKKISKFFGEEVCLLNYDDTKECLKDVEVKALRLYVLKVKGLFFILIKEEQITKLSQSSLTHLQFADIFDIKIQEPKSSKILSPAKQKKNDEKQHSQILLKSNTSVASSIKDLSGSRIKSSVIFPQNIKCHICCKESSEFNAVFWNYAYTCVECVLNPQKDTSFIPGNIIDKFLKGQKVQLKQYVTVCPECKSETAIPKYKPSNKPKSYRCGVCMKEICIEHQKMIIQCFCQCKCGKKTLSIPYIYVKYCLGCKIRLCEICGTKSDKQCACICPQCGLNTKVDHQVCTPSCSGCKAREIQLIKCQCEQKLCPKCYFSHFQPGSKQCPSLQEQAKN